MTTTVDNGSDQGNRYWRTSGGNDTQDKVFLLSYLEASEFFESKEARCCVPTEYAKAQSAQVNNDGNCWWWLRSPGGLQYAAALVNPDGSLGNSGSANRGRIAVRPAFWLNLESGIS